MWSAADDVKQGPPCGGRGLPTVYAIGRQGTPSGMKRYYGYKDKAYGAEVDGHDVAIEVDKKLMVLNRVRLYIDGKKVDEASVFYGDKTLEATTDTGFHVAVAINSGGAGALTRAQVKRPDGTWLDLQERTPRPQG
jgi:hypothetical protein